MPFSIRFGTLLALFQSTLLELIISGSDRGFSCGRSPTNRHRIMLNMFSESDLEAYLDEALPAATMASIEETLRHDRSLVERLIAINGRRDAGMHSLGEVWRRNRISCPTRQQLGS